MTSEAPPTHPLPTHRHSHSDSLGQYARYYFESRRSSSDNERIAHMTDDKLDDKVTDALGEVESARDGSTLENAKASWEGWREIAGMSVGAAVFVDLLFVMGAAGVYSSIDGTAGLALSVLLAAIGVAGILEKTLRRVR